ncbi:hypothetical protein HYN59_02795 [Flavobacterium album]|uniref:Uncharacterized protein n=1 Tax=Flavobacterium album TaxID=2175091 RepID=A0A2S1QV23_9FLAO|nr:hypothetical protein [Flavobacterium album]AWH84101.1 hypothetical protein HYN59_02795 [Flavobacterium album]
MRHKLLSFFICLLTSTILLAHAVVPHHHEQEHAILRHHHHEADGGLKGIFTTHCHSIDCFTSVAKHAASERTGNKHIGYAVLSENITPVAGIRFIQPKNYVPFSYTHSSFHLINIDFRGPPEFSV